MTNMRQIERKYIELQEGIREHGAECSQVPDVFFPEGDAEDIRFANVVAKAICADCPIKALCLDYALSAAMSGTWGGMTQEERFRLRPHSALQQRP